MLPVDFHVERRKQLLTQLKPNSVCVIPGASLVTRSRDTEYTFRQDSYFWYLTGFNEPDAWLVLSNSERYDGEYAILACLPKDEHAEIWQGRRIGPELAIDKYKVDDACTNAEIEWALTDLINQHTNLYYALGHSDEAEALVLEVLMQLRSAPKQSKSAPNNIVDVRPILDEMRLIKTVDEQAVMRDAARISANAHCRAMKALSHAKSEFQLEAEIQHEFAYNGARNAAYSTIVGGGVNACILHYTENTDALNDGDLVLIDAGAELHGYAADITRTFPVNGTFSSTQKRVYQIVLDAQLAALNALKPGATVANAMHECLVVLVSGLIELKILTGELDNLIHDKAYLPYFMHGLGHWLGLDVHDVGDYKQDDQDRPLLPGMVMTVEPGLYFPPTTDIPVEFRGIGIRIEDDIIITEDGHEVITSGVPKTIDGIEALIGKRA